MLELVRLNVELQLEVGFVPTYLQGTHGNNLGAIEGPDEFVTTDP